MLYFWNTFNHFIIFVYIQVTFITIVEKKRNVPPLQQNQLLKIETVA